ncbi:NADH:flavin oxidoreductase [Tepidibacter aestuarii]|uniref:NADH:flavin oxidoreductase n=1 Tax=Tepidibacter aestuarii TaxID=2925782 RepID=UPI0020C0CAF1|nr:NADH:flavin oxidoreductase [Tepidibacter aestuarii]CAH2214192.1 2,4-dienoyl-CoA reductase-like NADH-dependent reductase (Old Yellow Enzyme family) [Tepidibacter aestuarii]
MAYLNKPLNVSKLELKNRLVMPPMATAKSEGDGNVSQQIIDYYKEKSDGGYISLIIIEHSFVSQEGKASKNQLSVADNTTIEGLKRLADVIHKNDSKAIMQINHAGSAADQEIIGTTPVGPSVVANPRLGRVPRELAKHEILNIVKEFQNAALRVKEAGFDGVEIHSAHGYFLNQFLSPLTNKRTDEYGGSIYNRIRIHLQIIEAISEVVGKDFPILLRLGASDFVDGGTTIEDSKIAACEFEKAGVSILDISGGFCGYNLNGIKDQGYFAPLTEAIKKVVSIPVILTGGITEAQAAEELLLKGKADLIGVGRALLNNSDWAKNAIEKLS